jgi:hypothetical protein
MAYFFNAICNGAVGRPGTTHPGGRDPNMAEIIAPIKTLTVVRDKLVEERRALAVAMALGYRRRRTDDTNHANEMREAFIGIQNTIELIDHAIAHEVVIASGRSESFGVPTLEIDQ